jgi:hypothetical protein
MLLAEEVDGEGEGERGVEEGHVERGAVAEDLRTEA